jgi:hypothetical protein
MYVVHGKRKNGLHMGLAACHGAAHYASCSCNMVSIQDGNEVDDVKAVGKKVVIARTKLSQARMGTHT